MGIEIVGIGDEVLYGYTVNSNASFIARQLLENGFIPTRHSVVGDDGKRAKEVLEEALLRGSVVITTGGLGPTLDDWTRKIASEVFGVALEKNDALGKKLAHLFSHCSATLDDQMLQPQGAMLLENLLGTASGFILQDQKRFPAATLISLPGVPQEMKEMFVTHVLPYLLRVYNPQEKFLIKTVHFVGLFERQVDPLLRQITQSIPSVSTGIYPAYSTLSVHLKSKNPQDLVGAMSLLQEQYAEHIFEAPSGLISEAVHLTLLQKKITLATAESCTGGALSASFVSYPEASRYYLGSIIAYANSAKIKLLDVSPETLETCGAVSEEVTKQMAEHVRQTFGADFGIAVSGLLGPGGATATKSVGTVSASLSFKNYPTMSWTEHLRGSRQMLLDKVVFMLLAKSLLYLKQNS